WEVCWSAWEFSGWGIYGFLRGRTPAALFPGRWGPRESPSSSRFSLARPSWWGWWCCGRRLRGRAEPARAAARVYEFSFGALVERAASAAEGSSRAGGQADSLAGQ